MATDPFNLQLPASRRHVRRAARSGSGRHFGFTLVELTIVLAIFAIAIGLVVPALRILSGTRSVEQGANVISAFLARTREEAIASNAPRGVILYYDQKIGRFALEAVFYVDAATEQIDAVPDRDLVYLPAGVAALSVYSPSLRMYPTANAGTELGEFVDAPANEIRHMPCLVLFGRDGRLIQGRYWVRGTSALGQRINSADIWQDSPDPIGAGAPVVAKRLASQFLLELTDQEHFESAPDENKAAWLTANSSPIVINRYNGTLVQGE